MQDKIIYYQDELNDEFSGDEIATRTIDGSYRYQRDQIRDKLLHLFWYRMVAVPLAFLYMKLHFHHKIINKDILKKSRKTGFFLYGNHTHFLADALVPTVIGMPQDVSVIVHPNNVSMPYLGRITPYLGAIPLPDDMEAGKNFVHAIERVIHRKKIMMIYPEAHIWPFYTGIRPFKDTSFRYPVQYRMPVYCLTNTYQKRARGNRPKMVTYLDGPFYPDEHLKAKDQKQQLRNQVYEAMTTRAKENTLHLIRYEKATEQREG